MTLPVPLQHGLVAGAVLAVLCAVMALALRPRSALPVAGAVVSVATVAAVTYHRGQGIEARNGFPTALAIGAAGVALVAGLPRARIPTPAVVFLAAPFAALVAGDASSTTWIRVLVFATASIGAVACSRADDEWGDTGVSPILFAGTAAGVFLAVPDTEEAAALLGASLPIALLGWPWRLVTLGRAGTAGAVTVLAWVAAIGGQGRTPSIVGAIACLGVLLWLGVAARLRTRFRTERCHRVVPAGWSVPALIGAQALVVVIASRVGGVSDSLAVAIAVSAATTVAALMAATLITPPSSDDASFL